MNQKNQVNIGIALYENHSLLYQNLKKINDFDEINDYIQITIFDDSASRKLYNKYHRLFEDLPLRINYFLNPKNKGELANILSLLRNSTSELFAWSEDDDPLNLDFYIDAKQVLDERSDVVVVAPTVLD